jgi:hypothetical protein
MSWAMDREMQADLWYAEPESTEITISSTLALNEVSSLRRNGDRGAPKVPAAVGGAV